MDFFLVGSFEPELFSFIEVLSLQSIRGKPSDLFYPTAEGQRIFAVHNVSLIALQATDDKDVIRRGERRLGE